MNQFLTLHYYFSPFPNPNFQYSKLTLIICLLIILSGIILILVRKKMKKTGQTKWMHKYGNTLIVLGIVALGLLFCRETGIPYLSMRLWWVIVGIWFVYASFKAIQTCRKMKQFTYQNHASNQKAEDPLLKYLPKKKKK